MYNSIVRWSFRVVGLINTEEEKIQKSQNNKEFNIEIYCSLIGVKKKYETHRFL